MSEQVSILVRLHLPGAKVGDVITVDRDRADRLVNARYATYTDEKPTADYVDEPTVIPPTTAAGPPVTDLPADSAVKAEWVAVAETIGVETEGRTKADIVEDVKAAVGQT
jgi:hypothetical protein